MEITQATANPYAFIWGGHSQSFQSFVRFKFIISWPWPSWNRQFTHCLYYELCHANNKYLMSIECIVTWSSQSSCRTNTELSQFKQRTYFLAGPPQPKPRPLLKQIKCSTANIFRKLLSPTNFFVWPKNESSTRQRNKIYSINTWVNFISGIIVGSADAAWKEPGPSSGPEIPRVSLLLERSQCQHKAQ